MFAPISRTFERSYADHGALPPLPAFRRNRIRLPETVEENLAFLRAWQERCRVDAFVYDYPLGRAHYGDLGYCAIARVIAQDIGALPELGLNGYCSCQELRAALPNAWPNYVMGRMLWDRTLDPQPCRKNISRRCTAPAPPKRATRWSGSRRSARRITSTASAPGRTRRWPHGSAGRRTPPKRCGRWPPKNRHFAPICTKLPGNCLTITPDTVD